MSVLTQGLVGPSIPKPRPGHTLLYQLVDLAFQPMPIMFLRDQVDLDQSIPKLGRKVYLLRRIPVEALPPSMPSPPIPGKRMIVPAGNEATKNIGTHNVGS